MGLSLLIVVMKGIGIWAKKEAYHKAARFWIKIFAINFVMGVITGIPMEFQFGTNWAKFSELTGSIIGQTLAMEGTFSFFLESAFIGLMLFGEKKLSPKFHFATCSLVFLGSWLSGFFIIATHAWMQHPVGYTLLENGEFVLTSFSALFTNPWFFWEYLHNMIASVVTSSFVVAGIGAFYMLSKKHLEYGKIFLKVGVIGGFVSAFLVAFPTGDKQAKNVAKYQPSTLAAMEGLFESEVGAGIVLIGQPNMELKRIDNPIYIPNVLSMITYQRFNAEVKGMNEYPEEELPTNIPLLYYAFHTMVGLGTLFIALMSLAVFLLYRKKLFTTQWLLWVIMAFIPLPYIATTAGWITAEIGRQPYLVYKLLRTADGVSPTVSAGNTLFTFIGFIGIYFLLGLLFLLLVGKIINMGPEDDLQKTELS